MSPIPAEGTRVAYIGYEEAGLTIGTVGKVLAHGGAGSYVQWSNGQISLVAHEDIVPNRTSVRDEATWEGGGLVSLQVRAVYEGSGATGVVEALDQDGHLATLAPAAEEAIALVTARIRQDPSIREVLANLDPDEGEEVILAAAALILRDYVEEV